MPFYSTDDFSWTSSTPRRHRFAHYQPPTAIPRRKPSNGGVRVRDDESFEKALRRFKGYCNKAGVMQDIAKANARYEKPSVTKKKKAQASKRRVKRQKAIRHRRSGHGF